MFPDYHPVLPPLSPDPARPLATVYSYYQPEVRHGVDAWLKEQEGLAHQLLVSNLYPGLDEMHLGLVEAFKRAHTAQVSGWDALPHVAPTAGSSEGLFHLLSWWASHQKGAPLYQLEGEYQGYQAYARALGQEVQSVPALAESVRVLPPGLFLCSHPSARDGEQLADELLNAMSEQHHLLLDLAYAGMSESLQVRLEQLAPWAVVCSLSKPLGLYYHRVGLCFTREPLPSLYGTRWFKHAPSILLGEYLLQHLDLSELRARRQREQREAVRRCSEDLGIELLPSSVWLLARLPAEQAGLIPEATPAGLRRAGGLRVCLTDYLMRAERERARKRELSPPDNSRGVSGA